MRKKYPEYKNYSPEELSKRILKFWKENNIFNKSINNRKNNPTFNFYEGPPSANGAPGIHHVLSRTIKDSFCRYKTLKGFRVNRRAGWDTHGLPVEIQVEKILGITKDDVGKKISIEDYNKECKKTVMSYKNQWDDLTTKMGYWVDLENPYITFDRDYIESTWSLLKQFFDKGLIYKGYSIQPYSPAAGTGLSSHELNMPGCYKNIKDTSIVAQFKIKDTSNDYFLAWTTTPWTLPANSALAVGKNIEYVKIETFNQYTKNPINVILAKDTISKYFKEKYKVDKIKTDIDFDSKTIPWKIIEYYKGSDLINKRYEPLFTYVEPKGDAYKIILGDFVSTEDGTGIVHISPTFGADDMRVAQKSNISPILVLNEQGNKVPIVDKNGKFVKEITNFAGKYVKSEYESEEVLKDPNYLSTDVLIAIKLKKENKAFKVEKYEHNYPHCWRTDKPILYYPLDSWFIKTTKYKDRMIELNKKINWIPTTTGSGRFGNWLENMVDWNISRERYWGIPLPIWRSEDSQEQKCIGSITELKNEVEKSIQHGYMKNQLPSDFDLHKPFVDDIVLVSQKGKKMYREKEVIDVWFDSGAMPYAQIHYPIENKEKFNKEFPADLIAEGVDQTRGWFFTLHTIAVMLFDSIAFKNVIVNGLVLDKQGNKMSKRLGNSVAPLEIIEKYGADAVRWYMISNTNPWENLKFDIEEIEKIQRKFFNTLENTYGFFALYANIDNFDYENHIDFNLLLQSDKWIISKLNSLIKEVTTCYDKYNLTKAARLIQNFTVNDLSNWYVRQNRKRFWKSENNTEKLGAYQTLFDCIITIAKLSSPIAPFYAERLYQDLNITSNKNVFSSIHLTNFPRYEKHKINLKLENEMSQVQVITSLVHSLRKAHKIKVRQPLEKILIPIVNEKQKKSIESYKSLILSEINVKNIEYLNNNQEIIQKQIKPNYKKLGKEYGSKIKIIAQEIDKLNQDQIALLESEGIIEIELSTGKIILSQKDVIISSKDIPGWVVATDEKITVALDIRMNDELKKEGIARELVNRIQNIRKEKAFDVQDKIKIKIKNDNEIVNKAISEYKNYISSETQALDLGFYSNNNSDSKKFNIDNFSIEAIIEKC